MVRALLAKARLVLLVAKSGRHPNPTLVVQSRVVIVKMRSPDLFVAPIGRRSEGRQHCCVARSRHLVHVRISDRRRMLYRRVRFWIKDGKGIHAVFGLTEYWAIRIDRGVTLVGQS